MSTELKTIVGKVEDTHEVRTKAVTYEDAKLHVTSFYGGHSRGRCIQLTIDHFQKRYIQLTREEVKELVKTLTEWENAGPMKKVKP